MGLLKPAAFLTLLAPSLRRMLRKPLPLLMAFAMLSTCMATMVTTGDTAEAILVSPLPFPAPDQLLFVSGTPELPVSDQLAWWQERVRSAELATYSTRSVKVSVGPIPRGLVAADISPSFFRVLGVSPAGWSTDRVGGTKAPPSPEVCISARLWAQAFGRTSGVVGRSIQVDGEMFTISGIVDDRFEYPYNTDLWLVGAGGSKSDDTSALSSPVYLLARLKPLATIAQSQAEFSSAFGQAGEMLARSKVSAGVAPSVGLLRDQQVGAIRLVLLLLAFAVFLMFLSASAAATGILLSDLSERRTSDSIRLAMGEPRGRLVGRGLLQSLGLGCVSAAAGALVGHLAIESLRKELSKTIPGFAHLEMNPWITIAGGALVLAGALVPALVSGWAVISERMPLFVRLRENGQFSSSSQGGQRVIIAAEIACALALLNLTVLVLAQLDTLFVGKPGFNPEGVIRMELSNTGSRPRPDTTVEFQGDILSRVQGLGGVQSAAFVSNVPFSGTGNSFIWVDKDSVPVTETMILYATDSYFSVMEIPVVSGTARRPAGSDPTDVIVSRTLASLLGIGPRTIGAHIRLEGEKSDRTVAGIVEDVRYRGMGEKPEPEIYLSFARPYQGIGVAKMNLVVKGSRNSRALIETLRALATGANPDLIVSDPVNLQDLINRTSSVPLIRAAVVFSLAGISLAVSLFGVSGTVRRGISARTRELGIRIALGESRLSIIGIFVGQTLRTSLVGVVGGEAITLLIAFGLPGRNALADLAMHHLIYGLPVLLLFTAGIASVLPSYRASRMRPQDALRYE